jgi:hypothetical protein
LARKTRAYRYEVVAGRLVLFPVARKYDDYVSIPPSVSQKAPRLAAARAYTKWLRLHAPGFENLLEPALKGDPRAHAYADSIELKPRSTVIEHLTQLLGDDETLMFSIEPAPSGKPMLAFYVSLASSRGSLDSTPGQEGASTVGSCPTETRTFGFAVRIGAPVARAAGAST